MEDPPEVPKITKSLRRGFFGHLKSQDWESNHTHNP